MRAIALILPSALLLSAVLHGLSASASASERPIDFSLQIRPLLSEKCFSCHGPDEAHREAKLRLDEEQSAKATRKGGAAIVPGDPTHSQVWTRILTTDPDDVMPPPSTHRTLSTADRALIRRWIEQGASWGTHWAFAPLTPVDPAWPGGAAGIDAAVAAAQARQGLSFAPAATPQALARRLALDLTGLPPTPERADALAAASDRPAAIAAYVDELLATPAFGEHWARLWLDLARYADTKGYEKDLTREMWLYRDWVIAALNADMPFDQFTIEQLAGDLLPNATQAQLTATAFHRNTMTNDEGGTDNEEFRLAAVKDRVDTTGQVWLGLSVGCAKCHSHKYDPIAQQDYYRFLAIFDQTEDADRYDDSPALNLPTPEQEARRVELDQAVATLRKELEEARKESPNPAKREDSAPEDTPVIAEIKVRLKAAKNALNEHKATIPSVLVMRELPANKRRTTRLHKRGSFLDQGDVVQPAVLPLPGIAQPEGSGPVDRLVAARWLVSAGNPLTPRVVANRIWARLFGIGLVETEEDFGALGSLPSNAALLDLLAHTYRDTSGWSLKQFLRTVVLSRTYQQAVVLDAQRRDQDPLNRSLSRGARFRLTAEQVRDQALAVSGLLSGKVGGRSVMPPQPDGLWRSTYNATSWVTATGEDRYRRGLYTFLKRTTPYPSMTTFDAGSGEICQVRRLSTNTPLQALVTLNDPVYLEAAAALGKRMWSSAGDERAQAERGLRLALIRPVSDVEIAAVLAAKRQASVVFAASPTDAVALLKAANVTAVAADAPAHASWMMAASVILNLDELLTRN
jgi:Protein of unknown function (DUF1549)/Protein of unknown function (DUF1553)/Planctomycete cytochrome C